MSKSYLRVGNVNISVKFSVGTILVIRKLCKMEVSVMSSLNHAVQCFSELRSQIQ
jgi:hypothetical protein